MALKITINIAKKIPGGSDFSSTQASCSLEGEVAAGQDPTAEAERLYLQAESAVDRQLGIQPSELVHSVHPEQQLANGGARRAISPEADRSRLGVATNGKAFDYNAHAPALSVASAPGIVNRSIINANGHSPSRPRRPTPATDAQLRLLLRFFSEGKLSAEALLQHHQIGDVRHLTIQQASAAIESVVGKKSVRA